MNGMSVKVSTIKQSKSSRHEENFVYPEAQRIYILRFTFVKTVQPAPASLNGGNG